MPFLLEMGKEIARLYENAGVNKILTIETSGIPIAFAAAQFMNVPVVFVKKNKSGNIADNLYSYFVTESDYVILLSGQQSDAELMTVAAYTADGYTEIDRDVSLNNFVFNSKSIAYIKNTGAYDAYGAGDMYFYNPENGVSQTAENVTKIFYVNKS